MTGTKFVPWLSDKSKLLMFDLPEDLEDETLDTLFEKPGDVIYEIRVKLNAWRDE